MPKIKTDAINTNKIIDTNMRVLRENFVNKSYAFRSKLANIAPKTVKHHVQAKKANMKSKFTELLKTFFLLHNNYNHNQLH
ncbi:hypothetical protein BTR34_09210 [Maribacter hydrothermalis]|nr:hypothetical protein BTR34_09210 [Maribacter hydrothermalis]